MAEPVVVPGASAASCQPRVFSDHDLGRETQAAGATRLGPVRSHLTVKQDFQGVDREDALDSCGDADRALVGQRQRVTNLRSVHAESEDRTSTQEGLTGADCGAPGFVGEFLVAESCVGPVQVREAVAARSPFLQGLARWLVPPAQARLNEGTIERVTLSPDGSRLYVTGERQEASGSICGGVVSARALRRRRLRPDYDLVGHGLDRLGDAAIWS